MKAITLHQPYASLIAAGVKTIETRSWSPPAALIGQRIAIHAGKAKVVRVPVPDEILVKGFPLGAIVATAILQDACKVVDAGEDSISAWVSTVGMPLGNAEGIKRGFEPDPYGDFSVGRWLWLLEDIQPLPEPIPARGYQGFWEWDDAGTN